MAASVVPGLPRPVAVWTGLAAAALVAAVALALPGDPAHYAFWRDTVAHDLPFLGATLALLAAPTSDPVRRRAWRVLGTGCGVALLGNLVITLRPEWLVPAVLCWLTFYGTTFASTALLLRDRLMSPDAASWLDPLAAGTAAAAVTLGLVVPGSLSPVAGRPLWLQVAVLAYPAVDIALMAMLVGTGLVAGRGDRQWWLVFAGLALYTVSDLGELVQAAAGTYRPGNWVNLGWPVAMCLFGAAPWLRDRPAVAVVRVRFWVPVLACAAAVALLVVGQTQRLPVPAVVLAVLAVLLGAARIGLAVRTMLRAALRLRPEVPRGVLRAAGRRALVHDLGRVLADARGPVWLALVDVNHFREVNDSLGERAGDRLLAAVARRLGSSLPPGATPTWLGGDKFAVVIDETRTGLDVGLGALQGVFARPFDVDRVRFPLSVSVGVSSAPVGTASAEELLAWADIALHRARRDGTGVETYRSDRSERDDPSPERLALLAALHEALADQRLVLHYQPQLDPVTGRPVGVEALLRWPHPTLGLLGPLDFLPLAQQFSLMPAVTDFVLTRAIHDAAELRRLGWPLRVAVNVSATDLSDAGLPRRLNQLLGRSRLSPDQLIVEVSEDAVLRDHDTAMGVLHQIRALGARLSLDDYGTGQASLHYLQQLPIGEVKLARQFLVGVPDDAANAAIVRSTVALAHELNLQVVIEGVETAGALAFLAGLDCDLAQGFHLAAPLPFSDLRDWLADRRALLST